MFIIDSSSSRLAQWATDATVAAATGCVLCECVCVCVLLHENIYSICVREHVCVSDNCVCINVCVCVDRCVTIFTRMFVCVCV